MNWRGLQARQVLATTGTLAVLYCIVVLSYVATSPDLRFRCLLFDSTRPSGLPEEVHGVVMRRVELGRESVPPNCKLPREGDVLTRVAGGRVLSFFDFSLQVSGLRHAQLKDNGQLAQGADISEHMDTAPDLLQDTSMRRWVRIAFYSPRSPTDASGEAIWTQHETYVLVQDIPTAKLF